MEASSQTLMEPVADPEDGPSAPYVGLRGHELVSWALRAGPDCVVTLGSHQKNYFEAICNRRGVAWPQGFFESTLEELMPHRA